MAEAVEEEAPPEVEAVAVEGLGREVAMKERTEAMVKKRRGAAEEEVRREVGVEEEEEEVGEGEEVVVVERREVVGSMELWRWRRFESISKNDSSIFLFSWFLGSGFVFLLLFLGSLRSFLD